MSGPKTSHYTLTPEQRRILEEQRKCRVQLAVMEKKKKDARSVVVEADRIIALTEPLLNELQTEDSTLQLAKDLRNQAMETVNRAGQMDETSGLEALRQTNEKLQQNFRTHLLGEVLTTEGTITVVIEPAFLNDDKVVAIQ